MITGIARFVFFIVLIVLTHFSFMLNAQNMPISVKQAWQRYALASASLLALGLGFLWALVDKEEFFLHDRLMKTRLIQCV